MLGRTFSVDVDPMQVAVVQKSLRQLDPQLKRQLTKELRTELKPIAQQIAGAVPVQAPLSGMTPRWGYAKASVRTFVNARPGRAIATINVQGDGYAFNRLLSITERAGSRTSGYSRRGTDMIRALNQPDRYPMKGKGGRFIWSAWMKYRPQATRAALNIINRWTFEINLKLRTR
jgi:hypothetical protein